MQKTIVVPLDSPQLPIAVAQIEGPLPNGKHRAYVGGRDTFLWNSRNDVRARIEKAESIVNFIHEKHPDVRIIVFPEYSIPILESLELLTSKANDFNLIIIPGADNISDPATGRILNKCPILIPGHPEPAWVVKRDLSQWEKGFVDEPEERENPIFHWKVGEQSFWFSVYICLDLALAPEDHSHHRPDPGLYITPMCSPDVDSMRTIGDFLLRDPGGRACILCNAVGESAPGSSSVMAVTVDGKRSKPAVMLPATTENLLIVEVNCDSLVLPKKSSLKPRSAIGRRLHYKLVNLQRGVEFFPADVDDHSPVIGVLNPALFEHRGVTMRIAFLDVRDYAGILEKGELKNFEILAVLGQHDVMVTHLSPDDYEMAYDVKEVIGFQGGMEDSDEGESTSIPHFEVERYFKVIGKVLSPNHRKALRRLDGAIPTDQEWESLFSLALNWETSSVDEATRQKFKDRHWILGETNSRPGDISAVIAIYLDHANARITKPFDVFEDQILPGLIEKLEVTSAYGGTGRRIDLHYIIRLTTSVDRLFPIIEEIHHAARRFKILIRTSTYVVVRKVARLSLKEACLRPVMAPGERSYIHAHLTPHWNKQQKEQFTGLPESHQRVIMRYFQRFDTALDLLSRDSQVGSLVSEWRRKAAEGLLEQDLNRIIEIHVRLHARVENIVTELIDTPPVLDDWMSELKIPPKTREKLTFGEKIRLIRHGVQKGSFSLQLQQIVEQLSPVVSVRNDVMHGRLDDLSIESLLEAIEAYCKVITEWSITQQPALQ